MKSLVILMLTCLFLTSSSSQNSVASSSVTHVGGGVQFVVKQERFCRALAPADWNLTCNPQASTVELSSPDGRLYAGWGVASINRAMQPYYGDLYGDPETSIRTLVGVITGEPGNVRYTSPQQLIGDYFAARTIESQRKKGLVFYRIYPQFGGNYIESVYFAITDKELWPTRGVIAVNVAASIRATTQLLPSPSSGRSGSSRGGTSRGEDPSGPIDKSYNKELGWQRVHSPTTGEDFIMSPSDYLETGPDGPGYYRKAGNSYEKLTLGWSP